MTTATTTHPQEIEVSGSRFTAATYEPFLWLGERRGMRERRARLLSRARGSVLEIGAGTGLNLEHYPAAVEELVLAEPVEAMAAKIRRRRERTPAGAGAQVVIATGEDLPFADDSFDTVVSTMVLCTVQDAERAVSEIKRVLRPGGRLLFIEHVRADTDRLARWQDRLAGMWAGFAEGCRCDRDTLRLISDRMRLDELERARWRGMPMIVQPLVLGEAVA